MGDLDVRLFLDRLPEQRLRDLTTTELINLAKRMLDGPQMWSHLSPRSVSCQHVLHPIIRIGVGCFHWRGEAKLLPGGQYVLFKNRTSLECWDDAEERLIWTHQRRPELAVVCDFAAEMTMAKLPSVSYVSVSMPTIPIAKSAYFVIWDLHPCQNLCRNLSRL
jgi:hypothetical protein